MEISWLGHNCFRLRGRDATVLTDPASPASGYRIGKVTANIATISRSGSESDYRAALAPETRFVAGPGEYDIAGVLITGVRTDHNVERPGAERNVAYVIDLDDI